MTPAEHQRALEEIADGMDFRLPGIELLVAGTIALLAITFALLYLALRS